MNFCSHCGTNIRDEARFCSSCGTATEEADAGRDTPSGSHRWRILWAASALLVIGGAGAFAVARVSGDGENSAAVSDQSATQASVGPKTFEECVADPQMQNYRCQGLPRATPQTTRHSTGDPGYQSCVETLRFENQGVQGAGLSEAEMAAGCQIGGQFRIAADCHDDISCAAAEAEIESSDGAGNVGSKTCLQWTTNYAQRHVGGSGGSSWDGTRWVQSNPGRWEQYPTGQTCVRWG